MRKPITLFPAILAVFLFISMPLFPCTNIFAARDNMVLAGQNWDWKNLNVYAWFVPPQEDLFGCFFYGLKVGYPAGGINDQGLVVSGALTPGIKINRVKGKKDISTPFEAIRLNKRIYQTCATVAQVINQIKSINLIYLKTCHLLIADKTGASVIIEGDKKGNLVLLYPDRQVTMIPDNKHKQWLELDPQPLPSHLENKNKYQVITNFLHCQLELSSRLGGFPCQRFRTAEKMLDRPSRISTSLFTDILSKTHLEGEYPTKLSVIYDLKKGDVILYYIHNFKQKIEFNLTTELKKGRMVYDLRSWFKLRRQPIFLLYALILMSAVIVPPIRYFIRRIKHGKTSAARVKNQKSAIAALFVAGINSILVLIIIYQYPYILSQQTELIKNNLNQNFFHLYFGKIFYLIVFLTTVMAIFTPIAWLKKYWPIAGKIHYSLVLAAAVSIIIILV